MSPKQDSEWYLLLFENSFLFLPYFLAATHRGAIPCAQETPNSPYKMDKLIQKISTYQIRQVLVQESTYHKKWFQKLLNQVPDEYKSRFIPAPDFEEEGKSPIDHQKSEIAFVQFTSGTTSDAKALGITHDNVAYAIESLSSRVGRNSETVSISWLPHYHDLGLVDGLLTGVYWGSSTYLMEGSHFISNPVSWLAAISKYQITHSSAPNFAYDLCADRFRADREQLNLSSVKSLLLGGEMIKATTLQRFAGQFQEYGLDTSCLLPGYGMAETTLAVCCQSPSSLADKFSSFDANQVVSCGAVFEGTEVSIVSDCGTPVGESEIGHIQLSGKGVAKRWKDGSFEEVLAVKTGDIGFKVNGYLYLIGRTGDLMIKNGQNYALSEVEEIVATAHPAINTSGVVAILTQTKESAENFEVVVELKRGKREKEDYTGIVNAIRLSLAKALGLFPDRITLLPYWHIPRTSSGKKQKKQITDLLARKAIQPLSESN